MIKVIEMKKIIRISIIILFIFIVSSVMVNAAEDKNETVDNNLYADQSRLTGADKLYSGLPEETQKLISEMKINILDQEDISKPELGNIFPAIADLVVNNSRSPVRMIFTSLGIFLLCSLAEGADVMSGGSTLKKNINAISSLGVCACCILPLCDLVDRCSEVINGASGFISVYVPVMTGLLVSSSHSITGSSYYSSMMGTAEVIGLVSSKLIIPMIKIFLTLSAVSTLSPSLRVSGLCSAISRGIKWILNFSLGIFVTIMTAQSLISSTMDDVSNRAAKFAVNTFVPIVGGVLSETVNTFTGSLSLLKSGTGVFVLIASSCIFLPALVECILWRFSFSALGAISDMLGLSLPASAVKSVESVCSLITAVLLTTVLIFIISTVILLIITK